MKTLRFIMPLLFLVSGLFGCAANSSVTKVVEVPKPTPEVSILDTFQGIKVECASANKLGCRHKGRTYPWGAWLEVKGYSSKKYALIDVVQAGNRATVLVEER